MLPGSTQIGSARLHHAVLRMRCIPHNSQLHATDQMRQLADSQGTLKMFRGVWLPTSAKVCGNALDCFHNGSQSAAGVPCLAAHCCVHSIACSRD